MMFPLLLVMTNSRQCENYEFDPEKAELHLQRKELKSGCSEFPNNL